MHVMDLSCSWIELNYNDVLFVWKISIPLHRDSNLIHKSSDYKNLFMWLKPEQWKMSIWKINDWRIIYKYSQRLCRRVFNSQSNMKIEPFLHSFEHSLNWALPPSFSILRANKSQQSQSPHCFDVHFLAESISSFEYVPFSGKLSQHIDMHIKTV